MERAGAADAKYGPVEGHTTGNPLASLECIQGTRIPLYHSCCLFYPFIFCNLTYRIDMAREVSKRMAWLRNDGSSIFIQYLLTVSVSVGGSCGLCGSQLWRSALARVSSVTRHEPSARRRGHPLGSGATAPKAAQESAWQ